jgi:hypothetical protein
MDPQKSTPVLMTKTEIIHALHALVDLIRGQGTIVHVPDIIVMMKISWHNLKQCEDSFIFIIRSV